MAVMESSGLEATHHVQARVGEEEFPPDVATEDGQLVPLQTGHRLQSGNR